MNKRGFTLIELLAIIALLGIIITIATMNVIPIFNSSKSKLTEIQKKELEEAVKLYIEDYCINPIGSNKCPSDFKIEYDSNGIPYISSGSITVKTLKNQEYIDTDKCDGSIKITNGVIDSSKVTCNFQQ